MSAQPLTNTASAFPLPRWRATTVDALPLELSLAAVLALTLALWVPLATTVIALLLLGVAHNLQELRYVVRRFAATLLAMRLLTTLLVLIGLVATLRLAAVLDWVSPGVARQGEIGLFYAVLGVALWQLPRTRLVLGVTVITLLAAAASWVWPAWHFLLLTHLHNVLPWLFLRNAASESRATQKLLLPLGMAVFLLVPALIIFTSLGDHAFLQPGAMLAGSWTVFSRKLILPEWQNSLLAQRLLITFAYLQLVHFILWVVIFPRLLPAPDPATTPPVARIAADPRAGQIAGVLAVTAGALFLWDFAATQRVYPIFATWHAYLEFPILLWFLLGVHSPHQTP